VTILHRAIERAQRRVHIGNGQLGTGIEVEEDPEAPILSKNAYDTIRTTDLNGRKCHSDHIGYVALEHSMAG
jgi:hypothetical protein